MNLTMDRDGDAVIIRVGDSKMTYQALPEFADAVTGHIDGGDPRVVIDLSQVVYIDSATIGCLMDLYRQADKAGGALKLAGVQPRVETMLTMTGTNRFIGLHPDELSAVRSFGE